MHFRKAFFINTQGPARESMDERFRGKCGKYDIKRKRMKNWGKTGGRLRTDRQRDKHETPSRTSRGKLSLNDGHSWFLPNANNVLQVFKVANPNQVLSKLLHVFVKIGSCHSTMVTLGAFLQQCPTTMCCWFVFCWSLRCRWFSLCQIALLWLFTLLLICWIQCSPPTMGKLVASIFNTEAEYEANVFVQILLL